MNLLKKELNKYFSDTRKSKKTIYTDIIIIFLIFLTLLFYVLESFNLNKEIYNFIIKLEYIILILFAIEFFIRIYISKDKFNHLFSFYTMLDFIAIFPFFFGFTNLKFLKILRFFRFFRYVKKYLSFSHIKYSDLTIEKIFLGRIVFSLFCILFISSSLIYEVEKYTNSNINNFFDSFHFILNLVTTIGYNNVFMTTIFGEILVIVIIIVSIILIPWQIGGLVNYIVHHKHQKIISCETCKLKYHDEDAFHCKNCGNKIK